MLTDELKARFQDLVETQPFTPDIEAILRRSRRVSRRRHLVWGAGAVAGLATVALIIAAIPNGGPHERGSTLITPNSQGPTVGSTPGPTPTTAISVLASPGPSTYAWPGPSHPGKYPLVYASHVVLTFTHNGQYDWHTRSLPLSQGHPGAGRVDARTDSHAHILIMAPPQYGAHGTYLDFQITVTDLTGPAKLYVGFAGNERQAHLNVPPHMELTPPSHPVRGILCDTPTRSVVGYLDWPCATGHPNALDLKLFKSARSAGGMTLRQQTGEASGPLRSRVLAFGALPNGTPGSQVAVVLVWAADGTGLAILATEVSSPGNHGRSGVLGPYGAALSGNPELLAGTVAPYENINSPDECAQMAAHPPVPPANPAVTCTQTVVVRDGIAAVRLVRGPGNLGPVVTVHDRLAGVDINTGAQHGRKGWTIEGLDAAGNVIGVTPWSSF